MNKEIHDMQLQRIKRVLVYTMNNYFRNYKAYCKPHFNITVNLE